MINEEIKNFEALTGKNANDFSISYVGGYLDGYDKGKEDRIYGYKAEDLIRLAMALRDSDITEIDLKAFNEAFAFGYRQASEDNYKALETYVSTMVNNITPEVVIESVIKKIKEGNNNDSK